MDKFFMRKGKKRVSQTMIVGALITAMVIFSITLFAASHIFTQSFSKQSESNARTLSKLTFDNMYQIMSQGWNRKQLLSFLQSTKQTYQDQNLNFSIYRADIVNQQFGYLDSKVSDGMHPFFIKVLQSKVPTVFQKDNYIRILQPLKAHQICLKCHTQAKEGEILGIMGIEQDLDVTLKPARNEFLLWMLLLIPIPIVLALLVGRRFSKSLIKSVANLDQQIVSIQQIDDLKNFAHGASLFEYEEFDRLNLSLNHLGDKIKNIAIDRDILDFELQLLDKLVLSSEILQDWKQHICVLMEELNRILPLYVLFAIFRTDDDAQYVVEFFWLGKPIASVQKEMEVHAKELLCEVSFFDKNALMKVNHSYASQQPLNIKKKMQTQSKSLMLETPKIGGVVGIGVETFPPKDSTRTVVVESILTTLVNVIGSIKAINKFTKELEYYATRDPLTHLFNQRVFHELLSYEVTRAEVHGYSFGLMMIDFDNFKLINDQYGHAFGDVVLQTFATAVGNVLRKGDIFARYGGDEFCVILPECDLAEAIESGHSILAAAAGIELTEPGGNRVHITCSMGISLYPDSATTKEDLFMVADNMLYRVKDSGKNALSYPEEADLIEVYKESNDLSRFITQSLETGEPLEPHYQPIVNMKTGEVEVHELLMRLRHDGELISAQRFIETAEQMGLVNQMDLVLIDKALAHIKETGYQGKLFINLSPKAIVLSEFLEKIRTLALKYDVKHDHIVFEITERETVHNMSILEKFVRELHTQGFRFAIDDFGSGFSSFQYLKRFPVDFIKIEGEFINNMSKNKIDLAFVKSAVSMANALGIKTIAEYIENDETLNLVRELGIDFAQGFLLATPQADFLEALKPELLQLISHPLKSKES